MVLRGRRGRGGVAREGREVRRRRAWTHAGAAATGLDAEGRGQVEVRDVRTPLAGPGDADQGVHVGAVGVYLPAVLVHDLADLDHVLLEHAVRGRVGDHDRGQAVGVFRGPGAEFLAVDVAVGVDGRDHPGHAAPLDRKSVVPGKEVAVRVN